jgi:aryl-alcohol dehydrogenase-like predicted oxidoreductase
VLAATITIDRGAAFLDGLLLEPYVVTHRSAGRAALVPAPGSWVPGSQRRDRDRLVLPVAEGALRFCLGHPAVSTVIVGMRTARHVEANCRASDAKRLPAAQRHALRRHAWRRNYYTDWDKAGV